MGLVSLAARSRSASNIGNNTSKEPTQVNTDNCTINSPPPPQMQQLSTVTPSNSTLNVQALQASNSSSTSSSNPSSSNGNKRCLSCVSESSYSTADTSSKRAKIFVSCDTSSVMNVKSPPKHPLTSQPSSEFHSSRKSTHSDIPMYPLPVPRLDMHHIDSEPGYTLYMKRESEVPFDDTRLYDSRYKANDIHENRLLPLQPRMRPGPPRYFSAPNGCHGHAHYDRERRTPPPLPRESKRDMISVTKMNENVVIDNIKRRSEITRLPVARHYGPEMRGGYTSSRASSEIQDSYIRQVASRDDVEERSQYFRSSGRHFPPDQPHFSPNQQYLPPRRQQHYGPTVHRPLQPVTRPRSNFQHQHYMHVNRAYEPRAQFQCPDGPIPRGNLPQHPSHHSSHNMHPHSPYQPYHPNNHLAPQNPDLNVTKTILRRKCAWKNYPELEKFLIENREEYLKHSAKNYTIEQKQYNNRLTERLLEVAAKHNYVFDPNDFNFVAVRDRIRCYYKSYVQSNKKRGVIVGYDASGMKKKQTSDEKKVERADTKPDPSKESSELSNKDQVQAETKDVEDESPNTRKNCSDEDKIHAV